MQTIKNLITKNYKILLISLLTVSVVILVIINPFKKPEELQSSPFSKVTTDKKVGEEYFEVTKALPEETQVEAWGTYVPIIVFFSESVEESSIKVEVFPDEPVLVIKINENDNHVQIVPRNGWRHNINYIITIKEALSVNGKALETPYVHSLRITRPAEKPKIY